MSMTGGRHSETAQRAGRLPGEHPGRSRNPVIKVARHRLAGVREARSGARRGVRPRLRIQTALRGPDEVQLRGTDAGAPCVHPASRRRSRFVGWRSGPRRGRRAAAGRCRPARRRGRCPRPSAASAVGLVDPSGIPVRVVAGMHELPELPAQQPLLAQRRPRRQRAPTQPNAPAGARPGCSGSGTSVLQSTKYVEALNWYLDNLGMIVSDFLFFPGQRDRGPTMSFIRCDRGPTPADHHTLAMALGPANRYVHSAYQVSDLDALAAGGEYLRERGYFRSWGIGRHIQGSQIFDYWRDPDGFLVEHFADGDMFDNTLEPGWAPFTASGLAQWGPPVEQGLPRHRPRVRLAHEARVDAQRPARDATNSTSAASSAY